MTGKEYKFGNSFETSINYFSSILGNGRSRSKEQSNPFRHGPTHGGAKGDATT
jgi:hypothetical protein